MITIDMKPAIEAVTKKITTQARFAVANQVFAKMQVALTTVMANTPVWTGDTIANYVWGVGTPSSQYDPINQDVSWRSKSFPDPEGRSHYSAFSRAHLALVQTEVFTNPYRRFVLSNNVRYEDGRTISDLESGTLTGVPHLMFAKAKMAIR